MALPWTVKNTLIVGRRYLGRTPAFALAEAKETEAAQG